MELTVGEVLEGKVTGIAKFGAFVALPEPDACRLNRRFFGKGSDKMGNGRRNSKKYRILALRKSKKQKKL